MAFDIRKLAEGHAKLKNFTQYREEERLKEQPGGDSPEGRLRARIEALRNERTKFIAENDLAMAQAKAELVALGGIKGAGERRKAFEQRMRTEKAELKYAWEQSVREARAFGMTPRQILDAIPTLSSLPSIYGILGSTAKARETVVTTPDVSAIDPGEMFFEHSKHRPVHRYAYDRTNGLLKFYSPDPEDDNNVVVMWPSMEYLSGDLTLAKSINRSRAQTLVSIIEDEFDGELREADNPYDK